MKTKGILITIGTILVVFALTSCFLLYFSKNYKNQKIQKAEVLKTSEKKHQVQLASGKQVYEIITDNPRDPQIIEVELDPLDVKIGENQVVSAKIKTLADSVKAEDFVLGKAICDDKEFEFPFKLKKVEGKEELITTWQGSWERKEECTFEKNYQIEIFAKNVKGEDKVTLSLLASSCPTPKDGQDYNLATSCVFSWNINGVEYGNIIVNSGYTLTVGGIPGGQTIVFNPGYSIIINGNIAFNKTPGYEGQIKKAYICAKNSDNDGFYAYATDSASNCSNLSGSWQRRYTLSSLTEPDCCDSDANAKPYQTSYFTSPNACGSWDYDCNGTIEKNSNTCQGYTSYTQVATSCYYYLEPSTPCSSPDFTTSPYQPTNSTTINCGNTNTFYMCGLSPCFSDSKCNGGKPGLCAEIGSYSDTCSCR